MTKLAQRDWLRVPPAARVSACAPMSALLIALALAGCASPAPDRTVADHGCNDTLKTSFKPDAVTTVVAVRRISQGTQLVTVDGTTTAAADLCLVKLLVGPGNPGPADAPSTSAGLGIEVWLPTPANWNQRIRDYGGGGWVGGGHRLPDKIGSKVPATVNANIGYAVGTTDGGQPAYQDGSFTLLPDGSRNLRLLQDFAYRSVVEQALKTRALVRHYYGRDARFTYFDGQSTGGRQVMKIAQDFPALYDGYLVAAPAINLTRFAVASQYVQTVLKTDLGFNALDKARAADFANRFRAVNARAVAACDKEGLGFLLDPFACAYNPSRDAAALCAGNTGDGVVGSNVDAASCVSLKQAEAINKIWYGPTIDGSYQAEDRAEARSGQFLNPKQLWWGLTRGSDSSGRITNPGGVDWLALIHQDVAYTSSAQKFVNASSSRRDRWAELDHAGLTDAFVRGLTLQPEFHQVNTENPDLTRLRELKRKIIIHHGLGEDVIPPSGSVNYVHRVADKAGGMAQAQTFLRLYLTPAVAHSSQGRAYTVNGRNNSVPMPKLPGVGNQTPSPAQDQMFTALANWVEKDIAPGRIDISSTDGSTSYPICVYPQRAVYQGSGPTRQAASYACR